MMHKIAIGLAAATLAVGGPALAASAPHNLTSHSQHGGAHSARDHSPVGRVYGFEERGERLTPRQREHLRMEIRERVAKLIDELTPRQRAQLRSIIHEGYAAATPVQRERFRRFVHERYAEFTPREHEQIRRLLASRFGELTPLEREHLGRFIHERYRGGYGRAER